MYHTLVRQKLAQNFQKLNQGDFESIVTQFRSSTHHIFAGDLALGGERYSRDGVRQWYARLFSIFPGIRFTVRDIIIQGWPWHTSIVVQFQVDATLENGNAYQNEVAQFIQLKWGQIAYMKLYEDTQRLANALHIQAEAGFGEALAAPIVDAPAFRSA
ncbi:MAG: nuclear transport factor 2 family protein [Anaerolineaceae bacterium]|nr:nuclear transport factor 2 family protein [Anaerolineaceae bacterium]